MFSFEYHELYIVHIYMFSFEYHVLCNNAHFTYMFIYVCTVSAHIDIFIKRADFDFPLFSLVNKYLFANFNLFKSHPG